MKIKTSSHKKKKIHDIKKEQRIKDPLLKGAVVFNDMKETQSLAYSSITLQPNLSHCINLTIKILMLSIKLI